MPAAFYSDAEFHWYLHYKHLAVWMIRLVLEIFSFHRKKKKSLYFFQP